jgi:hypothetical protein
LWRPPELVTVSVPGYGVARASAYVWLVVGVVTVVVLPSPKTHLKLVPFVPVGYVEFSALYVTF